ncbi:hypothetical protein OS125_11295 [Corynebacterium sp. P7003]|uniref:Phage tail tape measure protein n=1 Tax=Corynebacterium pygosceleis TaxID=2800406 RepID=A0ABT3WUA8_9CORY|nr:hypothetical protein [Corynebacterium pygosceleis]MCX7445817.1 hypothetical protein [Corynebacterium pygosceleis]
MPAVGYAVLPITPSLRGLQAEIRSKLQGPVQEASRKAASALEKNMKQGAEAGAAAVEAARRREARAADQVVKAEKTVEDAKKATEAAVKAVEVAEKNLASTRASGEAKVLRAEQKLADLKASGKASVDDIRAAELDLQAVRDKTAGQAIAAEAKVEKARDTAKAKADAAASSEEKLQKARIQAEDATTNLGTATRRYEESAGAAVGNTSRWAAAMDKAKESAATMGASIAKAAEKYKIHAAVAGGAILALGKSSVDYASEAEQSYGAVESVFSAHAAGIVAQSKQAAEAVGLSGREYRELAAQTGAMMSNMGLPMDEVADKTQNLIGVASDLSATFGGSTKDALEAVNALLRGEADPIEKYGVSIKKSDINARLAAEGLDKLEGSAAKTAETQMLLKMLTEQTSAAQGQFGRETDTAAHKQQVMKAKIDDAREAIGTGLLPIMATFSDVAAKLAQVVGEHPKIFTALAGAFTLMAGAVVTLGTVAPIFTAISVAAGAAGMSMSAYAAAQIAAIAPIAAVVAAIAAVTAGLVWFFTQTETGQKIWATFTDGIVKGARWISSEFSSTWDILYNTVFVPWRLYMGVLLEAASVAWEGIKGGFQVLGDTLQFIWENIKTVVFVAWETALDVVAAAVMVFNDVLHGNFDQIAVHLAEAWLSIKARFFDAMQERLEAAKQWWTGIQVHIVASMQRAQDRIGEFPQKIRGMFSDARRWLVQAGVDITAGLMDGLQRGWRNVVDWARNRFSAGGLMGHAAGGMVPGYADGGHMGYRLPTSGPGTGRVDGFLAYDRAGMPAARLDAGEWVINRRSSAKYDRELAAMNAGTFPKLPGYADGGKHGATVTADMLEQFVKGGLGASKPLEGAPYVWGGVNWGDCSGAMSAIARFAAGLPPFAARFATPTMRGALTAMGFIMGHGGPGTLRMGWFNGGPYGGHTAGTLPNGVNVEMGGVRGNGQYGGGAAGADHPQFTDHAYLPIPSKGELGADILGAALGGDGGYRESASRQLAPVSQNVSFGSAQELYEAALLHLRGRTGLYDQGGFLPHGGLALNLSGRPEPVLTNSQWAAFENVARALPGVVEEMRRNNQRRDEAVGPLGEIARASSAIAAFGTQLGGSFLSNVKIVADAEKGLAETREAVLQDADAIASREKALAEAREELAKVSAESGELSVAATRKIADAEEALAKARADTGKNRAEKIAAAEKRLARAREDADRQLEKSTDKNAEAQRKALDKVAKAQDELGKVLDRNEDAAIRLEAAERAVAAARFTAVGELVQQGIGFLQKGADALARFGAEMQRMTDIAAQTRQEVSKLQQQQVSLRIAEIQSRHEAKVAELNIARVRAQGAVDVARAEAALAKARDGAMVLGETGVNALARSMERFRETGVWAIDMVQAKRTASLQEIAAAEAAVDKARAQAALNNLEAESASQQARLKVLESTLMQAQAAELLRLQTAKLTDQTAQLYGLSQREASGFAKGGQGLGGLLGGLGKIVGALALGAASAATMNPLGIAGAIGMGVSGIAQAVQGGRQLHENRDEFREGWRKLDPGKKLELGLGIAASGVTAIGGGAMALQTQDPRWAQAGFQAAGDISSATFDGFAAEAKRKFDAQTEAMEARIAEAKARFELERLDLEVKKATIDADAAARVDRLRAEIDLAGIREELAKASSKAELKALQEAEQVAATRRDELLAEERKQTALLSAPSPERSARRREPRQVTFQVIGDAVSVDQANRMLAVLNEQYEDLDARVQQIDEDRKPTAFDAVSARRG